MKGRGEKSLKKKGGEEADQQLDRKKIDWYKNKASRIENRFPFVSAVSLKLSLNLWWW